MANLKQREYMDEENLKMTFDFFDENHDGKISLSELQRIFSGTKQDVIIENILMLSDTNKDGEVWLYLT